RVDPVDERAGGKSVDEQHRLSLPIALVEVGQLEAIMGKGGKHRGIEVHEPAFLSVWTHRAASFGFKPPAMPFPPRSRGFFPTTQSAPGAIMSGATNKHRRRQWLGTASLTSRTTA